MPLQKRRRKAAPAAGSTDGDDASTVSKQLINDGTDVRPAPKGLPKSTATGAKSKPSPQERELRLEQLPLGTTARSLRAFFSATPPTYVRLDGNVACLGFTTVAAVAQSRERWKATLDAEAAFTSSRRKRGRKDTVTSESTGNKRKPNPSTEPDAVRVSPKAKQPRQIARQSVEDARADDQIELQRIAKDISKFAANRQLEGATACFQELEFQGLEPTVQIYANLMNAYVNSGDVAGAEDAFAKLKKAGLSPNVVVYTTLIKGHCRTGDIVRAALVFENMASQEPPVLPDVHAVNTFLRGCARVGDVDAAVSCFHKMKPEWGLTPDVAGKAFVVRLLCHALRLDEASSIARVAESSGVQAPEAKRSPCQFWAAGKCKRGSKCLFFHDPSILQNKQKRRMLEEHISEASIAVDLAHGHTLLGKTSESEAALRDASAACTAAAESCDSAGQWHQDAARLRLESEIERIRRFLREGRKADLSCLKRLLVFPGGLATGSRKVAIAALLDALSRSFGLDACSKLGLVQPSMITRHFRHCFTPGGHLKMQSLFGPKRNHLPLKLEICSGTGEWALAQAQAEADTANWVALEIMHERVFGIFSRMSLAGVKNLCVVGGDAADVLPQRFTQGAVSQICINYPEPPHASGDESAESALHLLTRDFFKHLHVVLKEGGGLTVLSDNARYLRSLAIIVANLDGDDGHRLFESKAAAGSQGVREDVEGVLIFSGLPGPAEGHRAQETSHFDALWANSSRRDRQFLALVKR